MNTNKVALSDTKTYAGLTKRAFELTQARLESFGNKLSTNQKQALIALISTFYDMATGRENNRIGYPMQTGIGKTTSVLCFIQAIHQLGYNDINIAVASGQIEQLCQNQRELFELGVSPEKIGLIHSYQYDRIRQARGDKGYASEPITQNNDQRQFLLMSHAHIKTREDIDEFMLMKDDSKRILIWDEALVASSSQSLNLKYVKQAAGYLQEDAKEGLAREAWQYLNESIRRFNGELKHQEKGNQPRLVNLPVISTDKLKQFKREAFPVIKSRDVRQTYNEFLTASQYELSIDKTKQGDGALFYKLVVPKKLNPITILDASLPIRQLEQLDDSIQVHDHWCDNIISYEKVQFNVIKHSSGRGEITKMMRRPKRERQLSKELVDIIKAIPKEEAVLIFSHKDKDTSYNKNRRGIAATLQNDLESAGVDLSASVQGDKPRFQWLTHGNESAYNTFSYCANVIYIGLMRMRDLDILSAIKGQMDNPRAKIDQTTVNNVELTEALYRCHQGCCRGTCRVIDGAVTKPMKVWVTFPIFDQFKDIMEAVMPKAIFTRFKSKYLKANGKAEQVMHKVKRYLKKIPDVVKSVSTRKIKGDLKIKMAETTYTRAITLIDKEPFSGWIKSGRGLQRNI